MAQQAGTLTKPTLTHSRASRAVFNRSLAQLSLVGLISIAAAAPAQGRVVYVRADAALGSGDGSLAQPFRRITDALHAVQTLADVGTRETFIVDVGPGVYVGAYSAALLAAHPDWEVLPLWINVSHTEVRGATNIVSGLDRNEPLVVETDTLLTVGERIVSTTAGGLPAGSVQVMMILGPTAGGSNVTQVSVRGMHFDGIFHDGVGVFVDRVAAFAIERSVFEHLGVGTRSRESSGTWNHVLATANVSGAVLTGGSVAQPAQLWLAQNRFVFNDEMGVIVNATGTNAIAIDPGQSGLTSAAIQTVFDLDDPADRRNVPDALTARVVDGDYSDNGWIGFRLFELGFRTNTYTTVRLDQAIASHLDVHFAGSSFERNGFTSTRTFGYGVSLDAGFPYRKVEGAEQPVYTGSYLLRFSDNVFSGNRTASLFAGFTRFVINTSFKPLRNSLIQLLEDSELGTVYDNPECDPFDATHTPLDNGLAVNDVIIPKNAPLCWPGSAAIDANGAPVAMPSATVTAGR